MRIRSRETMTDSRRPATALQRIRPQRPPTNAEADCATGDVAGPPCSGLTGQFCQRHVGVGQLR